MSMTDRVSIHIAGHGTYSTSADGLDVAISRYLPASPFDLRAMVARRTASPVSYWSDCLTVSELLMVLASMDEAERNAW